MSDTPETEAVHLRNQSSSFDYDRMLAHAKSLESQRDEARTQLAEKEKEFMAHAAEINVKYTVAENALAETQAKLDQALERADDNADMMRMADSKVSKLQAKLQEKLIDGDKWLSNAAEVEDLRRQLEAARNRDTSRVDTIAELNSHNLALSAALKQAREALKVMMELIQPENEKWEQESSMTRPLRAARVDYAYRLAIDALAIPADFGVGEEVTQGLEKIAAMPWENSESPYAKIALQLLTALRGKETR